jgi:alpha-methylacyl-CoA racemase
MVDGAAVLMSLFHGLRAAGAWFPEPGTNLLDSGAHFYEVYATSDGGHIAVGAIEPQFYHRLLELLEISPEEMPQFDRDRWPEFKTRLAGLFATRTRDEWAALLEHEEACATPVPGLDEVVEHHHNVARGTFVEINGVSQAAAAPRFDRTPGQARPAREDADVVLEEWGVGADEQARLREANALG